MRFRLVATVFAVAIPLSTALSQENPVRRVANVVSVAVEEYARGVDARGRIISAEEYREAVEFLADAAAQTARLSGQRDAARALLDSVVAAVAARRPPDSVRALQRRFASALGSEAALEMPTRATDLADGRRLFEQNCTRCHGVTGRGDGPEARLLKPKPASIGDAAAMRDRTPEHLYRVLSVGVAGTPMVGYAAALTADERWNIVSYLVSFRTDARRVAEGEGLYAQRCVQCHGALGAGDGPVTHTLSRMPQEIGSLAWQSTRTDNDLARAVRDGIPGTAMPASRELDATQVASVVEYLRTLPPRAPPPRAVAAAAPDHEAVARGVMALLQEALAAARSGRAGDASDRGFDAYIAFEPLETPARAWSPGLVASMERSFADFRGAVRSGDLRTAERARDAIEASMPSVLQLSRPAGSGFEAFWQSFLIIVREGFEAILVIGAIVAFLLKTGNRHRLRAIWIGVAWGLAASAVTAIALRTLLSAMPMSREVIEGATMLVAVAVLFSVSYWLISKVEAAKWQQFIREKVSDALEHGGGTALAFVAFLAVYREGAETALFYQALFRDGANVALPITLGIVVGAAALAVTFTLFFRFGVRMPLRPFFGATSVLLYYMAFVFMGKGVRELQEGDVVSITIIPGAPHVEALGLYPSVETLLAQLVLLVLFVVAVAKSFWPTRAVALPTLPQDPTAGALVEAQLAELRSAQDALAARLAELESLSREPSRSRSGD